MKCAQGRRRKMENNPNSLLWVVLEKESWNKDDGI